MQEDIPGFEKTYIRLRTVLDALEVHALRYCLELATPAERKARAEAIITELMPLVAKYGGVPTVSGGEQQSTMSLSVGSCSPGYSNCNGVCVPYQCPEFQ
jgi:hypothetical protein